MQRLLLIANPASSQFTGGVHRTVGRILSRRFDVEAAWPQSAVHARQLTSQAVEDGVDVVAAMGGDGVVHHVGQALVGTETALALIPTGTTNVYSRLYGIPRKPAAAARLLQGEHRRLAVPILTVDGVNDTGPSQRHVLFAAGFGFDAEVVKAAEGEPYRKYWFGGVHYARKAVTTLIKGFRDRQPNIRVTARGQTADAVAVLVQFHPVYTYFGRLPLTLAKRAPSPLTLLIAQGLPGRRIPRIAASVLTRRDLDSIRGLTVWEGIDSFTLTSDPPTEGQADGELTGAWKEATGTSSPRAIQLVVPSGT
jgi:diacylglycerol kinase family enzyme